MILRDPVERILSWYAHNTHLNKVNKWDNPSFRDMIFQIGTSDINETSLPIMTSRYSDYLPMWLKYFNRNQLLILDGDQFIADPYVLMKEVGQFLEVPPFFVERMFRRHPLKPFYCFIYQATRKYTCMTSDQQGKVYEKLSAETRSKLANYFKPYTKKLNELVGSNFSWTWSDIM